MKRLLPLWLVAIALVCQAAHADSAKVKQDILGKYQRRAHGLRTGDIAEFSRDHSDKFTCRYYAPAIVVGLRFYLKGYSNYSEAMTKANDVSITVRKLTVEKNRVTAIITQRYDITYRDINYTDHHLVQNVTAHETWFRENRDWKCVFARDTYAEGFMDGKRVRAHVGPIKVSSTS